MFFQRMNQILKQFDETIYKNASNKNVANKTVFLNEFININDKFQKAALNYFFNMLEKIDHKLTIGVDDDYKIYLLMQVNNNNQPKPLNWLQLNQIINLGSAKEFDQLSNSLNDQVTWANSIKFKDYRTNKDKIITKLKKLD